VVGVVVLNTDPGHRRRRLGVAYSPECVEGAFSELRLEGVLRSSVVRRVLDYILRHIFVGAGAAGTALSVFFVAEDVREDAKQA
jgi:hypothetical protein